ncbi:MAG TPA: peptide ABC transporter substrate-binding protein [Pyrinomonadaceae bacterium]|nr:peptide ABC transporter substrate-binding protein [Pyrinomonadaceae bacterium]
MSASAARTTNLLGILCACLIVVGCAASAKNEVFFGKTNPPRENVLRYVSGSEPESIDPQIPIGQNEARICLALYEGLAEYDPKSSQPIPALAESWDVNKDWSEVVFHLRRDGRFSNGDPITARDFVYTIRRGLTPSVAARYASLAYPIKYSQAFNEGGVFVFDPNSNSYLLERDFSEAAASPVALSSQAEALASEYGEKQGGPDTSFHHLMHLPMRLVLPGKEKKRDDLLDKNPKLKAAVAGKQLVPVKAEDVGVEAPDDYTLRISLVQPTPYFISMMPHQFFRAIHQKTIEKFGSAWTEAANIVTSGPFKLESWKHYDRIVVTRDPDYWDAAHVQLDKIVFYLLADTVTMLNLYKAGELDVTYNHTVPAAWLEVIGHLKDFMDGPEAGIDFYNFNTTSGPTKDVRVRKALNMSIDKKALAAWRHVAPLTAMTPDGIFPGYPQPKADPFDPEKAKRLLADAGYKDAAGNFDPKKFQASEIEIITNTDGSNVPYAEFIQAQWKQNLGTTVSIRVMENKTWSEAQSKLDYKGMSRTGWSADYMDPFTFLSIFYTPAGTNSTGWWDPKYVALLDQANRTTDKLQRYQLLSQAEQLLLDAQPVIPLVVGTTRLMKKPYVKGVYPNAATLIPWKYAYIERDPSKWDYGMPDMSEPTFTYGVKSVPGS